VTELAGRGHQIHVRTLSGELAHLAAIGIDGSAIGHAVQDNQLVDWRQRSRPRAALSVLRTLAERACLEAPELTRAIREHDPDVVLVDVNCWGAATAAEASGRAWATFSPCVLPLPSRDAPPVGLGLPPREGPRGRARDVIAQRVVSAVFDSQAMPSINKLRAGYRLPRVSYFSELLRGPPLVLVLVAEGLEYPRSDWPPNVRVVGPVSWAPPVATEEYAWLADLSDPLVLATCSTERQADARVIHAALAGLPPAGMSVLATTGAHDPQSFAAPTGSRVVRFLPHEAVLERAVCVVCHGGMGITQKALAASVPVVVVPFGRDQFEVARRVEVAEAGIRLHPRRLSPERLAQAVRTALARRDGAERIGRRQTRTAGHVAAADAIEALSP